MNNVTNHFRGGELRLFHTADLHLGSPFSGFDIKTAEQRRLRQVDLLARAMERARAEGCSAVLIAGDLFDCGYVDGDTVARALEILGGCGMTVVISPGNHDPFSPGGIYSARTLPENVHVFDSPEMNRILLPELGLAVHGYAFESERYTADPLADGIDLHPEYFNVLCAHGDLYSPISTYAPINQPQLESMGLDYVALGHVHKIAEPARLGRTLVAYPGFLEGRSFDECGFGGALVVSLSKDRQQIATASRVVISDKQYMVHTLDVTGASSKSDVQKAVARFVEDEKLGKETCLRLTLVGNVDPRTPDSISIPSDEVGLDLLEIQNETLPIFNAEYLENDITLRGALYRQLLPSLKSPDPEVRRVAVGALRMGLAALEGRMLIS